MEAKKIHQLVGSKPPEIEPVRRSSMPTLKRTLVLRIFKRFELIWGALWLNRYGDDNDFELLQLEWGTALNGIDNDKIARAIEFCREEYDFPPSIKQFKSAALDRPETMQEYVVRREAEQKLLANPATEETRKQALKDIKNIFGGRL